MSTSVYYRRATLWPTVVALTGSFILSLVFNRNYQSEWITAEAAVVMDMLAALAQTMVLLLLFLVIHLAELPFIRSNSDYVMITWFLVPLVGLGGLMSTVSFDNPQICTISLMVQVPFLIGLCYSYYSFRCNLYTHYE